MRQNSNLLARLGWGLLVRAAQPLWAALVLAGLSASVAHAAAPGPAPAAAAVAGPIAVPDILARADEDQQRVDRAKQLLQAADPAARLGRALDDIARPVDAKLNNTAGGALRSLPVMRLESLARHWEFDARRFARWEEQARRALAPYADSALQLAQRRAVWSATRAAGLLDGLPPAMSSRVDAMLGEIDTSEAALGATLARQFDLAQRASELKARIQAGSADVAFAIEDIDRRLLQTDVPPLWQGLGPSVGTEAAWRGMERGLQIERQFAMDYHAANTGNQQALRVVQLLLLPLIVWLVVRSRRAASDAAAPQHVARALRRPISSWLLLSMLAVLVLEPDAPLLVQELALVFALIPVLRLLPAGMLRALGAWPYVAIALYALDRLALAAVADAALYRLFLLALNVLALGLTVWLLRHPVSTATPHDSMLQRAVRPVGWAALAVLALAAACNIAGNVSLAEMLTSGVIDSGYMALLLYAAVAACIGILQALLGQPELTNRRLVREHERLVQTFCIRLLVLGAVLGWLLYALDRFRVLRPLRSMGTAVLDLGIDVGEVSLHLGDVLAFAVSIWIAYWAARAVRRLLRDELPGHVGLPRGAGNSIASLSYYGVLLLGVLVALSAAGFKVGQLALVFGALGVGIGFGLQNVVNNFVSGLVLMFERPIQPGDMVEVGTVAGTVREIGLRATTIRTYDGADVVVPNGLLVSGSLTNWTMFDRSRRFEVAISAAYGSDPAQVLALLEATARATPGIAEQPPPFAQMTGYGDSALNFVMRAWTQDIGTWGALRSDLFARTLAAMQAAGIEIPYNQLDVHLRSTPEPGAPAAMPVGSVP
ncbi:mechanosensitive ion channel family protein [Variovorax sp. LT1P1]|uniref:mechanosensitive ion channel family protein n=1 Tax=Variovorax sp. LT1P1 TaxID=3443730 RepID=UPI003F46B963